MVIRNIFVHSGCVLAASKQSHPPVGIPHSSVAPRQGAVCSSVTVSPLPLLSLPPPHRYVCVCDPQTNRILAGLIIGVVQKQAVCFGLLLTEVQTDRHTHTHTHTLWMNKPNFMRVVDLSTSSLTPWGTNSRDRQTNMRDMCRDTDWKWMNH